MMRHFWPILSLLSLGLLLMQMSRSPAQRGGDDDPLFSPLEEQKMLAQFKHELARQKPDVRRLAVERRDVARKLLEAYFSEFAAGKTTVTDFVVEASRNLLEAELALADTKAERIAALERHWMWAKKGELINQPKFEAGTIGPGNYYRIKSLRLEAEYRLVQALTGPDRGE